MSEITQAGPESIAHAAEALRRGELIACPTDTVFGLIADARNPDAVQAIFEAKGRGADTPLPVMITDLAEAEEIAAFDEAARRLTDAYWPGPLTIILPLQSSAGLAPAITAGLTTVGTRVPRHPVMLRLLAEFGGPLAVTSANRSGDSSALTAEEAAASLGEYVAVILDGAPSPSGAESTIVAIDQSRCNVLRKGDVSAADLERISGWPLADTD